MTGWLSRNTGPIVELAREWSVAIVIPASVRFHPRAARVRWSCSVLAASAVPVVPRECSGTREPRASRSRPSTFPSRQVHAQATPTSTPGSGRPAGQRCNRDDRLFPFPGTQSLMGGLHEETSSFWSHLREH
ncbi:hypothetical protein X777_11197 [Ooceraea biroi]|uniref:Uncharacterized protein n=1 Tax=Ooceraea biroi TaxID=2015173 RepID=A0A026W455_OOCBI|nr:hypothetical protein X777_11197 [Ooceraea biroi]